MKKILLILLPLLLYGDSKIVIEDFLGNTTNLEGK